MLATVVAGSALWFSSHAASAAVIVTPSKVERIRDNCVENQALLNRLHQTDTSLRTNRGNLYRTIGDKLMSPLNSRIAANDLDNTELEDITVKYNKAYNVFYSSYIAYDESLTKLLTINCIKEPVTFYNALLDSREKRASLSESNRKMSLVL